MSLHATTRMRFHGVAAYEILTRDGRRILCDPFLDQNPAPSDAQLQQALSTVLCRCFTHTRMLRAIKRYASQPRRSGVAAEAGRSVADAKAGA